MLRYHNLLRITLRSLNHTRCAQTEGLNIEKLEQESSQVDGKYYIQATNHTFSLPNIPILVFDEDIRLKEETLEKKRNKSRLRPQDRNRLFDKVPYEEPKFWTHGTLKYQRYMYGKYGDSSKVNPSLCWPTKQELTDSTEYEMVAHPFTIPEMIKKAWEDKEKKNADIRARDLEIVEKIKKLDGWIKDMKMKVQNKKAEAIAVKERKEKLIEEVRRYFGYTVDPRDDRFKEMLEKKEKEQKKAMKEARKKAKEAKLLEKLSIIKTDKKEGDLEKKSNE